MAENYGSIPKRRTGIAASKNHPQTMRLPNQVKEAHCLWVTATCAAEAPQEFVSLLTQFFTAGAAREFSAAAVFIRRSPGAGRGSCIE